MSLGNKVKGTVEQVQGKTQEAVGNLSGDRETQIRGKVKQAEGQIRSVPGGANSEAEVIGKSQQAESNIRRYQSDERQTSNPIDAIQH
ncbi:CsbD family protein [Pseudanabaenaceae cyanobacterium LEGE 13415]|nr:CsbD family protein [Pseudanabaenaceae cyanobacterium LEGE 13415]